MPIVLDGTANTVTPLTASGVATFTAGSAAAPSITNSGDTNTGIFFPAADTIAFTEGGTESMRINSSGGLSIGTTTDAGAYNILLGNSSYASTPNFNALNSSGQTSFGTQGTTAYGALAAGDGYIYTAKHVVLVSDSASGAIKFATGAGAGEKMRLDSSGNLGLGVTPSAWGTNYKAIESAGSAAFAISSANVNGINIATNAYATNSAWIYKTTGVASYYNPGEAGVHKWFVAPSGTAGNAITFTQAMSLDTSSNLAVGGTVSAGSITLKGTRIEVNANANSGAYVNLITTANLAAGTAGTIMIVGAENGNTNTTFYIIQYAKNGNSASVTYTGLNGVALASVGGTSTGNGLGALTFVQSGTSLQVRAANYLGNHVVAVITQYPDY